jgi:hypothetical protein
MIDALISIIDRLIQLTEYRGKRRRRLFEDVIEPIFNDLLLIHRDYIEMFQTTWRMLPLLPDEAKPKFVERNLWSNISHVGDLQLEWATFRLEERTIVETPEEFVAQTNRTIDYLREARRKYEPVRTKLRALVGAMKDSDMREDVTRFIGAVVAYFPDGTLEVKTMSSTGATQVLQALELYGVGDIPDDPFLRSKSAVNYGRAILKRLEADTRQRWAWVCEAFAALKVSVSKTD